MQRFGCGPRTIPLAAHLHRRLWNRPHPAADRDYPVAEKEEGRFYCQFCRDRFQAADWARVVSADPNAIILDTETTGLDINDQIIEIAVISTNGQVLLDTLVNIACLDHTAQDNVIHGITDEMLEDAPTFAGIYSELRCLLRGSLPGSLFTTPPLIIAP